MNRGEGTRRYTTNKKMGCWRQTVVVASSAAVMVPVRPVMSFVSGPVPAVAGVRRALGFAATTRLGGEFNNTYVVCYCCLYCCLLLLNESIYLRICRFLLR